MEKNSYINPLISRYASKEMSHIFSDQKRYSTWRNLWVALAEAQMELGLSTISKSQISEMKKHTNDIDFDIVAKREKEVRHDVMAHVYEFSLKCPTAAPIIHLGATSCFVTDNGDLLNFYEAFELIRIKLLNVIDKLSTFAEAYKSLPTLGLTHMQPAQLTTVGKRATLWLYDFLTDFNSITQALSAKRLRGVKGATGTQASFLNLFDGNSKKVAELDKLVANKMGVNNVFPVTGQTYTRKYDSELLKILEGIGESASKFATDLRLLQSMKEIEEPFEKGQIGSSSMAYKRNPMRSERITSLARFLLSLPINTAFTHATQWFERTLDDSANRRIVLPQAFLTADAILNLCLNVADGLVVNEKIIEKHINDELPFMATENILMACVKEGGNRQELHEEIRLMSMEAIKNTKNGLPCNLIELIKKNPKFKGIIKQIDSVLSPNNFIGRSIQQTDEFISESIAPILRQNSSLLGAKSNIEV